jgi:hypothetical protein
MLPFTRLWSSFERRIYLKSSNREPSVDREIRGYRFIPNSGRRFIQVNLQKPMYHPNDLSFALPHQQ